MKLPSLKIAARAAAIALALGATTLSAAPAFAQSQPSFSFGFSFGNHKPSYDRCLSDNQVRRLVRDAGYRDVRVYSDNGRYVRVRADQSRRSFIVTVDACRGRIVDRDRIRRR